jgi:hypothetical protein
MHVFFLLLLFYLPSFVEATPPIFRLIGTSKVDVGEASFNARWAVADFNDDGKSDIAFYMNPESGFSADVGSYPSPVRLFIQNKYGYLEDQTTIMSREPLSAVVGARLETADFNGDKKPDLIIADTGKDIYIDGKPGGGGISPVGITSVLLSNQNGYIRNEIYKLNNIGFIHNICLGDIDNDDWIDGFILSITGSSYLMKNNTGSLSATFNGLPQDLINPITISFPYGPIDGRFDYISFYGYTSCVFVDANRDGYKDLLVMPSATAPSGALFINNKKGNFSTSEPLQIHSLTGYGPGAALPETSFNRYGPVYLHSIAKDINNDGFDDVISIATKSHLNSTLTEDYRGTRIQVLINDGLVFKDDSSSRIIRFSWDKEQNYTHFDTISTFDIDSDNDLDLILHGQPNNVMTTKFLINDGNGYFTDKSSEFFESSPGIYIPFKDKNNVKIAKFNLVSTGKIKVENKEFNKWDLVVDTFEKTTISTPPQILNASLKKSSSTSKISNIVTGTSNNLNLKGGNGAYTLTVDTLGTNLTIKTVQNYMLQYQCLNANGIMTTGTSTLAKQNMLSQTKTLANSKTAKYVINCAKNKVTGNTDSVKVTLFNNKMQ